MRLFAANSINVYVFIYFIKYQMITMDKAGAKAAVYTFARLYVHMQSDMPCNDVCSSRTPL